MDWRMNSHQAMILAQLARHRMPALDLAHLLGWPAEAVYQELVSLEAQGKAKPVVTFVGKRVSTIEWTITQ